MLRKLLIILVLPCSLALFGCDDDYDGTFDDAGDRVEEGVEDTGEVFEDAGEGIEEGVEDTGDRIDDIGD